MKTVVIACGAGVATSTMVKIKVENLLRQHNIRANVLQVRLAELAGMDGKADLFVTTMKVDQAKYATKVIAGSAFLTGINQAAVETQIIEALSA